MIIFGINAYYHGDAAVVLAVDGKEGLIFHFCQGFWYRMLVDIRLNELRKKL